MRYLYFLFLLSSQLIALPLGNPAEASLYTRGAFFDPCAVNACSWKMMFAGDLDLRFGYYGDFTKDRKMDKFSFGDPIGTVAKTEMNTSALYTVANIYRWMDVFGTWGVSTITVDKTVNELVERGVLTFSPAFSWSVGTHATLIHWGPLYIGGEGQYFYTQPLVSTFFTYGSGEVNDFNDTNPTIWEEWQVGFGAAVQIESAWDVSFVPYIGIKFSQGKFVLRGLTFDFRNEQLQLPDLKPSEFVGWALGITLLNQSSMGITLEKRFLDESALFLLGEVRY